MTTSRPVRLFLIASMTTCLMGAWTSQASGQIAPAPLNPKDGPATPVTITPKPGETPKPDPEKPPGGLKPPGKPQPGPVQPPPQQDWACDAITHAIIVSKQTSDDDERAMTMYPATVFRAAGGNIDGCWLVTSLDALQFETGRRSVDIWFVGPTSGGNPGAFMKSSLPKVSSYRFIWSSKVPSIALIELSREESRTAEAAGAVRMWTDMPATQLPAATTLRVAWIDRWETSGKAVPKAAPKCVPAATTAPTDGDRVGITPSQETLLIGAPFLMSAGSAPRLAGIGFDPGAPYRPEGVTQIMTRASIEAIRSDAAPVEDLKMLERELPRWNNPKGYEGLTEFAARKGCPNFLSWRIGKISGSTLVDTYRPSTALGDGMRILGVVCEDPSVDATIELNREENKGHGREQHLALDAALGVRSATESAGSQRTTSVATTGSRTEGLTAASRILFLEAVPESSNSKPMPKPR